MPRSADAEVIDLHPTPISAEAFAPYGEIIQPADYGKSFDETDADLDLSQGVPRLYIMRSPYHGMEFSQITRHQRVTQCLGARDDRDWFIAVAPPDAPASALAPEAVQAFHVPGDTAIKLGRGTWHAGPYFTWDWVDFYNLELANTNQNDSDTVDLASTAQVRFRLLVP